MITLTAKINLLSGKNQTLSIASTKNFNANNISSGIGNVVGTKKRGKSPFILGASKLDGKSVLSSGVDYFIGKQLSNTNANGSFTTPYIITINGDNITALAISFDKENNGYPTYVFIDNDKYDNNSPVFFVNNLPKSPNSHRIGIYNWNKPNEPLVVTGIYVDVTIEVDRRNIISMSRSIFDRSDLKLPSYGIISNIGDIEFNDGDGTVLEYAEQLLLQSGLECKINLNNTLVEGATETIGLFETDQWQYDNNNRVVSVSLKDDLEEWQEINVEGIPYDPIKPESKSFRWLYNYLWELTNPRYPMLHYDKLEDKTREVLNTTYIQYPLLESGTLWQQWTKLCQVCQLHIYKNNDGIVVCRYNGGN